MLNRLFKYYSTFNNFKTTISIPSQNINWTKTDWDNHLTACKNSFVSLNIKKNDNILLWLNKNHISEGIITKLAALDYGLKVNYVNDIDSLILQIKEDKNKLIFVSPNEIVNINGKELKKVDILYDNIPELKNSKSNFKLNLSKNQNLNYIIQTGFYQKNGLTKFKDILNYTKKKVTENNEINKFSTEINKIKKNYKINNEENIIVLGDLLNDNLFKLGPLNSLLNSINTTLISDSNLEEANLTFLNHYNESYLLGEKKVLNNIKGSYFNDKIKQINI